MSKPARVTQKAEVPHSLAMLPSSLSSPGRLLGSADICRGALEPPLRPASEWADSPKCPLHADSPDSHDFRKCEEEKERPPTPISEWELLSRPPNLPSHA